jgi:2-polyprenyl-3-methyl-5-hydroxy-6-metoxy-1,4-benzoquinol methylase
MIDLNLVRENAKKLKKDGLEKKVLARAKDLHKDSIKTASEIFSMGKTVEEVRKEYKEHREKKKNGTSDLFYANDVTDEEFEKILKEEEERKISLSKDSKKKFLEKASYHVFPENLAAYMTLLGEDLNGVNFLDLGSGTGKYMPLLSIAMKKLGANVLAVDLKYECKKFDKLGIDYLGLDLSKFGNEFYHEFLEKDYGPLLKDKDVIAARSFLMGGFSREDYWTRLDGEEETRTYKKMINFLKSNNGKEALYELDNPLYQSENPKEKFEKDFGEILCGYGEKLKPFVIG